MLDSDRFVKIGQVLKSNGTAGQVLIGFRDFGTEDISETEPVFIDFDGLPVPFFLSGISARSGTRFLAHLTDVNSLEDAEELAGRAVYYPADAVDGDDGFPDFTGWKLYDSGVLVGEILGIEDIPRNPCLEVRTEKISPSVASRHLPEGRTVPPVLPYLLSQIHVLRHGC